jgi:hypothetical protein
MSKTYSSHHTKKDIALCFGERTGMFVEPKEIRVKGNWLFYKRPDYDDYIECYQAKHARYDSGVLCMEPWDHCNIEDSPFVPNNNDKVSKTLERLDKSYQRHEED